MKLLLIAMILISYACTKSTETKNLIDQSELAITYDNTKKTSQSSPDVIDFGTVAAGQTVKKRLTLLNSTTASLTVDLNDLTTKINATTRFSISANSCTPTLKVGKSCFVDISLNGDSSDNYDAIDSNVFSTASQGVNSFFGSVLLIGQKQSVIVTPPLTTSIRLSKSSDILSMTEPTPSISATYYMINDGQTAYKTPSFNALQYGSFEYNSCDNIILKPATTCSFRLIFMFDYATQVKNEYITFVSNDPKLDVSALALDIQVISQIYQAPITDVSFNVKGSITDLANATQTFMLFINNNGTTSVDLTTLTIPSPLIVQNSTCASVLKMKKNCHLQIAVDTTKTTNMQTFVGNILLNPHSVEIKAGTQANIQTTCDPNYSLDANNMCVGQLACTTFEDLQTNNPLITSAAGIIGIGGDMTSGCTFTCDTASGFYLNVTGLGCDNQRTCELYDTQTNGYNTSVYETITGQVYTSWTNGMPTTNRYNCSMTCPATYTLNTSLKACTKACSNTEAQLNGVNLSNVLAITGTIVGTDTSSCLIQSCQPGYVKSGNSKQCNFNPVSCQLSDLPNNGYSTSNVLSVMGIITSPGDYSACQIQACQNGYSVVNKVCTFTPVACQLSDLPNNGYSTANVATISGTITTPGRNYSSCQIATCQNGYNLANKSCVIASQYSSTTDTIIGFSNNNFDYADNAGLVMLKNGVSSNVGVTGRGMLETAGGSPTITYVGKTPSSTFYSTTNVGTVVLDNNSLVLKSETVIDGSLSMGYKDFNNPDIVYTAMSKKTFDVQYGENTETFVKYNLSTKLIENTIAYDNRFGSMIFSTNSSWKNAISGINESNNLKVGISTTGNYINIIDLTNMQFLQSTTSGNTSYAYYAFEYNSKKYIIEDKSGSALIYEFVSNGSPLLLKKTITTASKPVGHIVKNNGVVYFQTQNQLSFTLNLDTWTTTTVGGYSYGFTRVGQDLFRYSGAIVYKWNPFTGVESQIANFGSNEVNGIQSNNKQLLFILSASGSAYSISYYDTNTGLLTQTGQTVAANAVVDVIENAVLYRAITLVSGKYLPIYYIYNKTNNTVKSANTVYTQNISILSPYADEHLVNPTTLVGFYVQNTTTNGELYSINIDTNQMTLLKDLTPSFKLTTAISSAVNANNNSIYDSLFDPIMGYWMMPVSNKLLFVSESDGSSYASGNSISATEIKTPFLFQNNVYATGILPDTNSNTLDREILSFNYGNQSLIGFSNLYNKDGSYRQYNYGADLSKQTRLIESDQFYFAGQIVGSGVEPYVYKSSTGLFSRLCDINTGSETIVSSISSLPKFFQRRNNIIYFIANTTTYGYQIYSYDESNPGNGCSKLTNFNKIYSYYDMKIINDKIIAIVFDPTTNGIGMEFITYNISTGVSELSDYYPGTNINIPYSLFMGAQQRFSLFNNKIRFIGRNALGTAFARYESDGTVAGTVKIEDTTTTQSQFSSVYSYWGYGNKLDFTDGNRYWFMKDNVLKYVDASESLFSCSNPNNYIVSYIVGDTSQYLYVIINTKYLGFVDKTSGSCEIKIIQDSNGNPIVNGRPMNMIDR